MSGKILVLGGAHIDRRGRIAGETAPGASNPGSWFEEPGGGGFNAARNLARLGFDVTMISPRGGDPIGEMVSEAADFAGINDRPFVFLDRKTPSYTAIIEKDGNLVIALADMELYRFFVPRRLSIRWVRDAFAATDFILFDANLPEETAAAIVARAKALGKPVAAIAISPAKVVRLLPCLGGIDYLFMFLFVIAYLGGRADAPWAGGTRFIQTASVIAAASLLAVVFVALMLNAGGRLSDEAEITRAFGSPAAVGQLFLTDQLLSFEITSIVLLVAAVGGVVLGMRSAAEEEDEAT